MSQYKVVLVDYVTGLFEMTEPVLAYMRRRLADIETALHITVSDTEEAALAVAQDADLVMIQSVRPLLTEKVISQLGQCRGIIRVGLGYDSVDIATATRLGIPVSNVTNWCNDEVAEQAMTLLLCCARNVTALHNRVAQGGWNRGFSLPIFRMRGRTLGLLGFGRIARIVAERLRSFGLTILIYDPFIEAETAAEYGVQKVSLAELLNQADYISVHTPLTPETHHLLDAAAFAQMKDGVIIINTSRGPVIDEAALVDALRSGKVGGAGLDVMEQEPLPTDSPLRDFENVTHTPHLSSYSVEAVDTLYRSSVDIAAQLLQKQWIKTIVNPDVRPQAETRWGAYTDV